MIEMLPSTKRKVESNWYIYRQALYGFKHFYDILFDDYGMVWRSII